MSMIRWSICQAVYLLTVFYLESLRVHSRPCGYFFGLFEYLGSEVRCIHSNS